MEASELESLQYPIGKFTIPPSVTDQMVSQWIGQLEEYPKNLSRLVSGLSREQLNTPYRPGGWTLRQVVHHVADSHHNAYLRFKWALTEENPEIKPYDEKGFAELVDTKEGPVQLSLDHLSAVHARLVYLLKNLKASQLKRTYVHPWKKETFTVAATIGQYVWHGNHHYSHIRNLLLRKGWL